MSPHPRMTDTQRFASMVAHSTYGRLAFDRGRLSDMISSVELVRQYTTVQYAIAAARLRGEQSANATNFALIKVPFCHYIPELTFDRSGSESFICA